MYKKKRFLCLLFFPIKMNKMVKRWTKFHAKLLNFFLSSAHQFRIMLVIASSNPLSQFSLDVGAAIPALKRDFSFIK